MDSMPLEFSVYENPVPLLRRMLEEYDARGLISTLAVFEPGHLRLTMILLATVTDLVLKDLPRRIVDGEMGSAILLVSIKLGAAAINAAAVTG